MSDVYKSLAQRLEEAREALKEKRKESNVKKSICVSVGFYDFNFESFEEAIAFAETAAEAIDGDDKGKFVDMRVTWQRIEEEDEKDEVQKVESDRD